MDSQRLQLVLKEIQTCIDDFKKELAESEDHYQESLKLVSDSELGFLLMEQHIIHIERQRAALAEMKTLYEQAQNQLVKIDKSN